MIVIMGATGTIGSALVERLVDLGVPVRALSRDPEKLRHQIGEKAGRLSRSHRQMLPTPNRCAAHLQVPASSSSPCPTVQDKSNWKLQSFRLQANLESNTS